MIFETERLVLREMNQDDYRDLAEILQNSNVMYAFEVLKQDKVCSVIKVDNTSSIRVAESIGMRKEDTFIARYYNGDMLHYLYSVQP